MAIEVLNSQSGHLPMGQNGRIKVWGAFKFDGTDATGTLPLPLRRLESLQLTNSGAPDAGDEIPYGPDFTNGSVEVGDEGVAVGRTGAAPTADQVVSFEGLGY